MISIGILSVSLVLQFLAAFFALQMASKTGWCAAWGLISVALFLMAVRRSISFYQLLMGDGTAATFNPAELAALVISALMLFGVILIERLLLGQKEAEDSLRQSESRATDAEAQLIDALDNISEGFVLYDDKQRLVICNRRFREFYGYSETVAAPGVHNLHLGRLDVERGTVVSGDNHKYINRRETIERGQTKIFIIQLSNGRFLETRDHVTGAGGVVSIQADVTERKQADSALKQSEARLRSILDNSPASISLKDLDGRYVLVNQRFEDWFNVNKDHVRGKFPSEVLPEEVAGNTRNHDLEVMATGRSSVREEKITGNGATRTILTTKFPIYDRDRNISGIGSITSDITERTKAEDVVRRARDESELRVEERTRELVQEVTERRQVEKALAESEQLLSAHMNTTPLAVITWDKESRVTYWNPAAERIFGFSRDEMLDRTTMDKIVPEELHDYVAGINEKLADGQTGQHSINENLTKDGTRILCEWHNSVLEDPEGAPIGRAAIVEDITERKQMEDRLRDSEMRFRHVAWTMSDWIWEMDADLRFSYMSSGFERTLGTDSAVLIGKTRWETSGENTKTKKWKDHIEDMKAHREFRNFEYDFKTPAGPSLRVSVSGTPILDDDGTFKGFRGVCLDISERYKIEKALRDSEQRYQTIVDNQAEIVSQCTADGIRTFVNDTFCDFLGKTQDEVLGTSIFDGIPKEDLAAGKEHLRSLTPESPMGQVELRYRRADGEYRWLQWHDRATFDNKGNLVSVQCTARDVTERKVFEDRLLDAMTSIDGGAALYDADDRLVLCTDKYRQNLSDIEDLIVPGVSYEELVRGLVECGFYPGIGEGEGEAFIAGKARTHLAPEGFDEHCDHHGRWRRVDHYRTREGGRFVVTSDITDRVQAENAIRESEERFRDFGTTSSDWYWEMDENLRFSFFSDRFEEFTGLSPDALLGKTRQETGIPGVDETAWKQHLSDLAKHRSFREFIHSRTRPDGRVVHIAVNGMPVFDGDENFKGYRGTGSDVTFRIETEEALRNAKEEADTASRAKSEFLSSMSHELRTPLNAILGFGQLLQNNPTAPLTEKQTEHAGHIVSAGEHLLELINEILDLAKIEAGRMKLSKERVVLADVLKECFGLVAPLAEEKGVKVKIEPAAKNLPPVRADYRRLKQALTNLISNAIKYNESKGRVRVRCETVDDDFVRIFVEDDGSGIPDDLQGDIFEPFNRLNEENGMVEGTGIGLTITRKFIELMDGSIGFESVEGKGSTFWIQLPRAGDQDKAPKQLSEPAMVTLTADSSKIHRLLYVEDNPANRALMEEIIRRLPGVDLLLAPSAEAGLVMARSEKPDAIILDINLPGMDGFEALAELRKDKSTRHLPAIALSANAMPSDIKKGRAAGFRYYLTKPVRVEEILRVLEDVFGRKK